MNAASMLSHLRERAQHARTLRRLEQAAPGARLAERVHVRSPERLVLGPGVFIDVGAVLHCGGMDWCPDDGGITIGANSYIGPNSTLFGAAGIDIGASVLVSPGVVITSHQHTFERDDVEIRQQPLQFARVTLERDVWIGANATILPGVRVGAGSVVGAGAVVTRDVSAGTVVVGVPAHAIRTR